MNELRGNIVLPDRILYGATVQYSDKRIRKIISPDNSLSNQTNTDDFYILPGLVDIHNHGGMGFDYMDSTDEAFNGIRNYLTEHGITSALCTTVSSSKEILKQFLMFFISHKTKPIKGCDFIGVHVEGPYISKKNRGAHNIEALLLPDDGYELLLEYSDIIKLVTISPELPGMCDLIHDLREKGIVVSGGHDDADTSDIEQAVSAGMTHSTHIFCVMSAVHMRNNDRQCGLCEYSLVSDTITTEMIADNHHIPPLLATLIYKCKGAEKLCLVSDCIRIGGMPEDGKLYSLGNNSDDSAQKIMQYNGVGILADKSHYAGSVQSLDKMIANVVNYSKIPFVDAVKMASLTPAHVIGVSNKIGSIEVGKQADFCVMDKEFRVVKTICKGEVVYQA